LQYCPATVVAADSAKGFGFEAALATAFRAPAEEILRRLIFVNSGEVNT